MRFAVRATSCPPASSRRYGSDVQLSAHCHRPWSIVFIGDSTLQEIVLELVSFLLSATPDEFPNADRSHVHTVFDFGADWAVEDCLELSLGRV